MNFRQFLAQLIDVFLIELEEPGAFGFGQMGQRPFFCRDYLIGGAFRQKLSLLCKSQFFVLI